MGRVTEMQGRFSYFYCHLVEKFFEYLLVLGVDNPRFMHGIMLDVFTSIENYLDDIHDLRIVHISIRRYVATLLVVKDLDDYMTVKSFTIELHNRRFDTRCIHPERFTRGFNVEFSDTFIDSCKSIESFMQNADDASIDMALNHIFGNKSINKRSDGSKEENKKVSIEDIEKMLSDADVLTDNIDNILSEGDSEDEMPKYVSSHVSAE